MPDATTSEAQEAAPIPTAAALEAELAGLAGELVAFMQHHVGDAHLGADLAQDALAQALRSVQHLRQHERLKGWLFRIAVNRFNDHVRRKRIVTEEAMAEAQELPGRQSDRPDRAAMTRELDVLLRDELERLPERQRTVLMLHGVQGLTHPEIADLLGITPDAVKMSLFHGRERLRGRLADRMVDGLPDKRIQRKGGRS